MRSIQLENNEILLINGDLYIVQENFLADDKSFSLECLENCISKDLKTEIIFKQSNGKVLKVTEFNIRYGKKLK